MCYDVKFIRKILWFKRTTNRNVTTEEKYDVQFYKNQYNSVEYEKYCSLQFELIFIFNDQTYGNVIKNELKSSKQSLNYSHAQEKLLTFLSLKVRSKLQMLKCYDFQVINFPFFWIPDNEHKIVWYLFWYHLCFKIGCSRDIDYVENQYFININLVYFL